MKRRLVKRSFEAVVALLGTSLLVFALVHAIPADPVAAYVGPHADQATRVRVRRDLGLDDALWRQYARYLGRALKGDLGRSFVTEEPVAEALARRFPTTLALALGGVTIWLLIGVPLGILTAQRRNSFLDRSVFLLAMVGMSVPTFWLGRLLQFKIAYRDGLLPVAGFLSWQHLILPALTLGLASAGYYARLVHANLCEVLDQQYIRAARARGLPEATVLCKHALLNALPPVLTVLGADVAGLLGGVVFVENIFALPGLGELALQSVLNLDVPMIMGTVLFSAVIVIGANLLVDMLYYVIDPRVR